MHQKESMSSVGYWLKTSSSTSQIEHIPLNIYQIFKYFSQHRQIRLIDKKIEHLGYSKSGSSPSNTWSSIHDSAHSCLKKGSKYCTTEISQTYYFKFLFVKYFFQFLFRKPRKIAGIWDYIDLFSD